MDKVLILGVNGFIGKHFQDYIIDNNLLDNFSFVGGDREVERKIDIEYKKIELLDCENFQNLILKELPAYIINFTGSFNYNNFREMESINVGITKMIFEIVLKNSIPLKNILVIGSAAEYGLNNDLPLNENSPLNPLNAYGLTKAIQTLYSKFYFNNFGIKINVARTFNLVGKNISSLLSMGSFVKQIKSVDEGGVIFVGNLNTKRDFLNVKDAVSAYWKILINGQRGEVYNVCSGKSYYIKDMLNFLIEKSGKRIGFLVKKEYIRNNDVLDSFGDNTKLKNDIGWKEENDIFTALVDTLRD